MKRFSVGIWETVGGYFEVEAENQEKAEAKVFEMVSDYGMDGNDQKPKITHREFQVCDCEEL